MSAKAKGARVELKVRDWYQKQGYSFTKAGGSLGAWDLIGISEQDVLLIQVKANRPPGPAERKRLEEFPCPPCVKKLIVVWKDYARTPEVRVVGNPATYTDSRGVENDSRHTGANGTTAS